MRNRVCGPSNGEPSEPLAEHEQQHESKPEYRHGVECERDSREPAVERGARSECLNGAECDSRGERDQEPGNRQQKSVGERAGQHFDHWTVASDRDAKVSLNQAGEVAPVLHVHWAIESEVATHLVDGFGRCVRGLDQGAQGTARGNADQDEREGDHQEDDDGTLRQSLGDEPEQLH